MRKYKDRKFFSLTWKAVLAVSIATFTASSVIFIIGQVTLNNNYEQERAKTQQFYRQAFHSLLQRSKLDDANISWLIPAFLNPDISHQDYLSQIATLFDKNWFKIELESDLEAAYLLSKSGELIGNWGNAQNNISIFSKLFATVVANESPADQIICKVDCIHYFVSPFLHNGEFTGVFVFGINLADIVLQMRGITGAGIGILIWREYDGALQTQADIDGNFYKVIALTNAKQNAPIIQDFLSKRLKNQLPESIELKFREKSYEIITLPFNKDQETAKLIIIEDMSQVLADIDKATSLYAASGLISLALSGSILFLLLLRPSRRLRALVSLLPLIAEKKYSELDEVLPIPVSKGSYVDEINILDEAIHALYIKLKNLDEEIEQRTLRLSQRTLELQNERNFVANILDTSQVIIMTLNCQGKILTLNKFGERLLGYYEREIKNQPFTNMVFEGDDFITINDGIKMLEAQSLDCLNHECLIYSVHGAELYVSWFLTLIQNADTSPEILVVGMDLSERRKIEHKLSWLADHDALTGLYNRRKFEQELERTLQLAARYQQTGAIIFFDLDQFKYVNDSSGHKKGDELLVKVAEKLLAITRQTDIVARFGGDEFVVLAPQLSVSQAKELVQKICNEMAAVNILLEKEKHRVSISAGLLIYPVADYSEQDLMASVDIAMYKAKESGRGRWCLASMGDLNRDDARKRVNWKSKIEKALDEERFVLYFQPIMKIKDRSISRYECLLRLIDENGEIIPPGMVIKIAEQTGLIHKIDLRVLALAAAQQQEFIAQGIDINLSVNLSGDLLSNPGAFQIVKDCFDSRNVPLSKFTFEITESQAVTNLQSAQNFIQNISRRGGAFALDDFGVGFSSMSHLKHLPVQYLKIDGSFINKLTESREDRLFVNAINNVGHGMGIESVAEFVENEQILEALFKIGVDYAQGYGIGKPMPQPEFHIQQLTKQ